MSTLRFSTAGLGVGLVAVLVAGCSGAGGTGSPGTDTTNTGTNTSKGDGGVTNTTASFTCCLNDVFYVCPDKAAVDKCASGGAADMNECMAKCAGNPTCMSTCKPDVRATPDPSACTKQAGQACPATPSSNGGNDGGIKASCSNVAAGACGYDSQCGAARHCASGHCYDNESGSKCGYDSQCGSGNHCSDGCCQGNTTNTTCGYDSQCGSGNHCSGGKCYADETGSPCGYDSQCGAGGNCSNGKCQ